MADQNVGTGLAKMAETKRLLSTATGISRDPTALAAMFEHAQEVGHFISPMMVPPKPPEGCVVVVSGFLVDVKVDTYPIPGATKVGIHKGALDKISGMAGMSFGGPREGRIDDGSNPHYCHYRAVGTYRDLLGQMRTIEADKELDLRDGSANQKKMKPGEFDNQRAQILSMAQTKARNRVIRAAFGIRTAYEPAEFAKPFLVARLQFTGQTEDETLRRDFAKMNAASMMMGTQALYGPAPASALRLAAPPPVDAGRDDPEDRGGDPLPGTQDAPPSSAPVRPDSSSIPIYQGRGLPMKPIAETSDEALAKWASYLADMDAAGKVPSGLSKEVAGKQLGACLAEIDYRKAVAAQPEGPGY